MSAKAKATPAVAPRLHPAYIERWLEDHRFTIRQIERGDRIWPTSQGLIALEIADIERLIAFKDPVAWAWLNLTEREAVRDDETGEILTPAGAPWCLFQIQADLARIDGNLIIECGSEVGKTRDIVLGTLWEMDTADGPLSSGIAADSDITLEEIWTDVEFQLGENRLIGGGIVDEGSKPFRFKEFANGSRFEMRLCGHNGKQFRGWHVSRTIRADEAAMWKNPQQWSELWRALKPGASCRIYSTPDGDYSSPFFAICDRAVPVSAESLSKRSESSTGEEPRFRKFNISKRQLPPPFWTEARAAKYREQYGGEQSVGWQTNVEGKWGSPSYSIFPMPTLKPNLRHGAGLPDYRIVVAIIDRETKRLLFNAARLGPGIDADEPADREEMLTREVLPFLDGRQLGKLVSEFFPRVVDLINPRLVCGGDLGSAQDPTELLFQRVIGEKWIDVFRVHLVNADWPEQAELVAHLDHASGHQVRYGLDNGSAGSALVQVLTQMEQFRSCPVCKVPVYFAERLMAFGFGDHVDEIDLETGEPVPSPDRKDAAGNALPHRLSNKEFATRVLERKAQARHLEIAWDGGAGNPKLSSAQLLVNHTSTGVTSRGERRYKGKDDHHVDARRQAALVIVSELRGDPIPDATPENVVGLGARRVSAFDDSPGSISEAFRATAGAGRILGGLDW